MTTIFKMVVVFLPSAKGTAVVSPSRLHESAKRLTCTFDRLMKTQHLR
jgi:hypothetical protein